MREILFRGKRVDNGEWVYGTVEYHLVDGDLTRTKQEAFITYDSMDRIGKVYRDRFEVNLDTIGQYTGLVNQSNTMLFEGDILDESGYKFVVKFDQKWAKFKLQHNKTAIQYPEWNRGVLIRLIGNIYDNPELLDGGEI